MFRYYSLHIIIDAVHTYILPFLFLFLLHSLSLSLSLSSVFNEHTFYINNRLKGKFSEQWLQEEEKEEGERCIIIIN